MLKTVIEIILRSNRLYIKLKQLAGKCSETSVIFSNLYGIVRQVNDVRLLTVLIIQASNFRSV
jgi:hypothetical protein